jgi:glycosyltransferase involved in cell wall biosynthesis
MPSGAAVSRYIDWFCGMLQNKDPLYISDYEKIVNEEAACESAARPFLSVIMRTQGKRPEMLREALLCLAAQKDQDFETVLIGHKMNDEQTAAVKEIVEEQPCFLREKIRFFPLDHGTRTTPLNFGSAHARGEYAAVFDDDDLVTDNWVSVFHEAAKESPGMLIHAGVCSQQWMTLSAVSDKGGLKAAGDAVPEYTEPFEMLKQLRDNRCPVIGMAFPLYLFRKFGIIYDESLVVREDWDYIMRCSFIAGVKDVSEATSVYRKWENAESSAVVHNEKAWNENYITILEKFKGLPFFMLSGTEKAMPLERMNEIKGDWTDRRPDISFAALYFDRGYGMSQDDMLTKRFMTSGKYFDAVFEIPQEPDKKPIKDIRFDPGEDGLFAVKNVKAVLEYTDGSTETRGIAESVTNGLKGSGEIFFAKNDPYIIWFNMKKPLRLVRVTGEFTADISDEMEADFALSIKRRGLDRKLHSMLNRIKGK